MSLPRRITIAFTLLAFMLFAYYAIPPRPLKLEKNVVNDITQLNPIKVRKIIVPTNTQQIITAVKLHNGPVSIGGGRYSMGGQTATANALQIDMRKFKKILSFSKTNQEITVQTGITWRALIQFIDKYGLSVKIMQSYANFTVGGALSVNVHGRYIGEGPIILSVKKIKIVLSDGQLVEASPQQNQRLFYAAIGGYGGIGVITEATLSLTENCKIERKTAIMKVANYKAFFIKNIKSDKKIIFHNADVYPNDFDQLRLISYRKTNKNLTVEERIKPNNVNYGLHRFAIDLVGSDFGKWVRRKMVNPIYYGGNLVEWRNREATLDVQELEPTSRTNTTYVLQEYFVPVKNFGSFYPKLISVLKRNNVNVLNISIRHAKQDPGSLLAWAKTEVFAYVIYYKQGTDQRAKLKVKQWTTELIDAVIAEKGCYYLPYQIIATRQQFTLAYPSANQFFTLKKKLDPNYKFRNKLFDAYYSPKN